MRAVISVSLPEEMVARLDEVVTASGKAKSEIVKEALRRYLWRNASRPCVGAWPARPAAAAW